MLTQKKLNDTSNTVEKSVRKSLWMYEGEQIRQDTYKYLNKHNMNVQTPQWSYQQYTKI